MRSEARAKSVSGGVSCGFRDGCEGFFVGCPEIFVKFGSRSVACGADALETRLVTTLVNSPALGNGAL